MTQIINLLKERSKHCVNHVYFFWYNHEYFINIEIFSSLLLLYPGCYTSFPIQLSMVTDFLFITRSMIRAVGHPDGRWYDIFSPSDYTVNGIYMRNANKVTLRVDGSSRHHFLWMLKLLFLLSV